ncbi:hypothetical protein MMC11_004864 [Xylographa trunciseda]|nr:hypothetical protein [Xylographa trunciseda]
MTTAGSPPPATAAAGQAGDNDVEEADDGADDGLQDGADAVNDGHEARADGLEDGLDLLDGVLVPLEKELMGVIGRVIRDVLNV